VSTLGNLFAAINTINQPSQGARNIFLEGIIVAGSYKPDLATVQVTLGHTYAAASYPNAGPPVVVTASLATIGYGDQYGPVGGERALVIKAGTHWIALLEFGTDDSPNVPSGERWITHRKPARSANDANYGTNGEYTPSPVNSYTKWTNDGSSVGDNKGGWKTLVGETGVIQTSGGITITIDDAANQAKITMPGGLTIIADNASNTLQIGGSGTSSGDAIVRQSDLQSALNTLVSTIHTWATANFSTGASGSGWTGATPTAPTATGSSTSYTA
jgi:hypothetical protein